MSVTLVALVMLVALVLYVVTAGADFGGGIWDFFARGPRKEAQRKLIERAIAPIWEANHVWLILIVVLLFTGFPRAFALISIAFHVPLTLVLLGIVLRGAAFVFRQYGENDNATNRRWGRVFAVSSLATPLFLGMIIGTLSSNVLMIHSGVPRGGFFYPWIVNPLSLFVGMLTLTLFAFLAAVYLTVEADSEELRGDFRMRSFVSLGGVVMWLACALAFYPSTTQLAVRLFMRPLGIAFGALAIAFIAGAARALYRRTFERARIFAIGLAAFIVLGWGVSQYPYVIVGRYEAVTFSECAAPPTTLHLLLAVLALGSLLLFPSLFYMFRVFKKRI